MFKKLVICLVGLFFTASVYASSAKITSNDGTPIKQLVFFGGAWFDVPSYPVTHVNQDNVTAITPFSNNIKTGDSFKYTYDIKIPGEEASMFAWFDRNSKTGNGVEVGMIVDNTGALRYTLCESDRRAKFYLSVCDVKVQNGIATMNIFLQSK